MSEGGAGGTGRLERRARWLLRAYPAAYRADRDEEIIGTLLETVPPGRDWPPRRPLVTVGPAVITLGITASLAAACALAWLLRRRIHASPPMTS